MTDLKEDLERIKTDLKSEVRLTKIQAWLLQNAEPAIGIAALFLVIGLLIGILL